MKAKYFILGALALTLVACEKDFFTPDSPSATGTSAFKSALTTEQAIAGIYNVFGEDKSFRNRLCGGYSGLNTDIEYINKSSGQGYTSAIYTLDNGQGDLSGQNGKDPWGYLTTAIERAGTVVDGIRQYGDTTNAQFRYLLGEALTLRAFCYLEMIKLWGDVPDMFQPFTGDDINNLFTEKTDRNNIYDKLRVDLQDAARLMPWSAQCPGGAANYTGRPSKALALGLLARLDMMYAGLAMRPDVFTKGGTSACHVQYNIKDAGKRQELYEEVVNVCAQIIKNECALETFATRFPYEQVWRNLCADVTDYSKSEFIWAIPFMDATRGQVLCINGLKMDPSCAGVMINTEDGDTKTVQTKVQGMVRIVPTFLWDFEDGDLRRDVTVCPFQWMCDNGQSGAGKDPSIFPGAEPSDKKLYQKLATAQQMNLGKYRVEWMRHKYNVNEDGVDLPVIRYADILLMFAEASIGSKEGNAPKNETGITGQEAFDAVRARAGLASKPLTFQAIMDERAFEFCGENIRKYDLMRWGILGDQLKKTMGRLANMQAGTGEFAGRLDSVYFKYKISTETLSQFPDSIHAYVFDQIVGIKKGAVRPADFDKSNGWVAKSLYTKDDEEQYLDPAKYFLYSPTTDVDRHQYWPIFQVNIDASKGALWNDYDY